MSTQKTFDLEERTENYARSVRRVLKQFPSNPVTLPDIRQLVRSSGSVGANYIEANESVSKKDFVLRIKYCRKEAKESRYWLRLLQDSATGDLKKQLSELEQESQELTNIFGAILKKSQPQ